ncbi:MAG TPA: STAS domain-containing protein [Micromonosporaceae bacterium]
MTDIASSIDRPSVTSLVEIVVDEDLTAEAAVRLHGRLADAWRLRPAQLVVDLSGCGYADALAIDVLLNAHRQAYQAGGRLTLRSPSERVLRLLHLARVHHVFHIVGASGC